MKAIVFGAGKIARGFIGQLLYLSNYEIVFVDVSKDLVHKLNEDKSYHVHVLGDSSLDNDVTNYKALTFDDEASIAKELVTSDISFVAVGGQNLGSVGKLVASIYNKNGIEEKPFNFITCENWKDAGKALYDSIKQELKKDLHNDFDNYIGINEAVIMRTATQPSEELSEADPTGVWVQNYWYLPVDSKNFKGSIPAIHSMKLIDDFGNFLQQKMYTNNTSNAVIAYNGYLLGYNLIAEATNSPEISKLLDKAYKEINSILIMELNLDPEKQEEFAKKARAKYGDWEIVDRIIRHGKDPLRKLGPEDRLIAPARMAYRYNIYPEIIIDTIAKAIMFDEKSDEAAQKLQEMRKDNGVEYVLQTVSKLNPKEPLYQDVIQRYNELMEKGVEKSYE
ncbi:mannitol-1-phosphate 5-dehydrogenase [Breznakia pachnodae]|uniref:Mannitol-1-phosphate 5-dehydrogenase n=1 Tax=Breznakia pachnodae TaxID=265178 RepID=A0ABU0E8I3_9FIRM|nr:mannitol-1-phosphate 5-dehydrogenase [Breznakia pachnodae]MDQ0363211.1 mannitol-1-phosphate 5-dehydrogenase [Breznakia pachnodae]